MRIPSGVTDQYIYFVAVDATDLKTRETGLSSFTVYRSRNGGAATAMTTPTVNETSSANMPGVYELLLDEDMTIDAGDDSQEMVFHITHSGMAPVTRTIELYRPKITAGNTLSVESDGDLTKVNTLDGHTAQTGDSYARLGAPAGASISADIAAIEAQTDDIGTAGAGLTAVPWNAAWDAEVQSEVADALAVYDPPTKAELDSGLAALNDLDAAGIRSAVGLASANLDTQLAALPTAAENADAVLDEALSGHTTAGTLGKAVADIETDATAILADTNELQTGDVPGLIAALNDLDAAGVRAAVGLASANLDTQLAALPTAGENADAVWDEALSGHPTSGSTGEALNAAGAAGDLWATTLPGSYTGSQAGKMLSDILTDTAVIGAAGAGLTEAGGTGDHLTALPWNAAWDAEVQSEAADALTAYDPPTKAELDSAVAPLATAAALSTVDSVVDAILVDTGTTLDGKLNTIDGIVDSILVDTAELQGDWTNGGRLDLLVDAILADTNELQSDDVPGLIAALNNISAAQVNAEVVDALATDTYAEPSGVPAATATLATKLGWLFMALRNQVTVTATKKTFFDDSGAAEWEKDLSDDGTTYTETEASSI